MIRGNYFNTSIGQREQAQGRVKEAYSGGGVRVCFWKKEEENEYEREGLVLVCEKMLFMGKKLCANKEHGRKLCVASSCSGVYGRISMNKPLNSYLELIFFLKSTVGFVSNFKKIQFRKCKISSKKFSIIGVATRELHLLEVEGVEIVCFFSRIWSK